ncbi:MAG TPA: class I SAM-dependent methyltransferase [Candidatus Angelobacter sp.]|nr:class I SAM-dependent methyltransferase [Candidatus Angelobacter sp.]
MSALQSTAHGPQPSPALFFDTVQSYQRAFILKAGVDLDLFSGIGKGNHTVQEIAKSCHAPERGIRVLCDCLTVLGFLSKSGNRYTLTPDSAAFLDSRSPSYLGRALDFMLDQRQIGSIQNLSEIVRNGKPPENTFTVTPEDPMWVNFARGMAPLMYPAAQTIAQLLRPALSGKKEPVKVLDIAAGHGTFGITLAEQFHNAQVYALDWPNVLQVAQENAVAHSVQDRYHLLPGSAFDVEWGTGYDAVLLTNFLHHFDPAANVGLLKKAHAALKPKGQVVLLEFIPNEDRVSPPQPAMFSVVMFSTTPNGDAYTFSQLAKMCSEAGFGDPRLEQLNGAPQSLVVAQKAG